MQAFPGYSITDRTPDHSSLSIIRQRLPLAIHEHTGTPKSLFMDTQSTGRRSWASTTQRENEPSSTVSPRLRPPLPPLGRLSTRLAGSPAPVFHHACNPIPATDNDDMSRVGGISTICRAATLAALSGCVAPGPVALNFSVRTIARGEFDRAFEAAQEALVDLGYRILSRDRAGGVLTAEPARIEPPDISPITRRRSPAQRRRAVELRVKPSTEGIKVYCTVTLQRQTTEAHRWLAFDRSSSDMPGRTPIERDAATTMEQNTVWETIRRDKTAERAILTAILDRLQPA